MGPLVDWPDRSLESHCSLHCRSSLTLQIPMKDAPFSLVEVEGRISSFLAPDTSLGANLMWRSPKIMLGEFRYSTILFGASLLVNFLWSNPLVYQILKNTNSLGHFREIENIGIFWDHLPAEHCFQSPISDVIFRFLLEIPGIKISHCCLF